jgi:organic radical activating enzyme
MMNNRLMKINEIFYSLQGEGVHTGTPAIFVRFSGCNLCCPFCDTQHEQGTAMSLEEILRAVGKFPCPTVVLTGGEPGLWVDEHLVDELHRLGKTVCIETNGTCELPANIDWVTCSPKEHGTLRVKRVDEVKVVYTGQDVEPYLQIPARHYCLQPCSCQNTAEVIAYIMEHPAWRLSLQMHKMVNIQ